MAWSLLRRRRHGGSSSSGSDGERAAEPLARVAADTMDYWQPLLSILGAQVTDVVEHTERAAFAVMSEVAEADTEADRLVGLTRTLLTCSSASADRAAEASRNTANAVTQLVDLLDDRDRAMRALSGEARTLTGHIDAIATIAKTTMILALNAKIEAARAGDAGAGFAVVADEVGHLSRASAEAAENIRQGITQVTTLMERQDAQGSPGQSTASSSASSSDIGVRLHAIADAQRDMEVALTDTTNATRAAAEDVDQAATSLQGRTTAILAEAQFQDITRQSLESVTGALGELGERVALVAAQLRDSGNVAGLQELDTSIATLEASYVSQRQRQVHSGTVGDRDGQAVDGEAAVELF